MDCSAYATEILFGVSEIVFLATLKCVGFKKCFVLGGILSHFTFTIAFNCEWIMANFAPGSEVLH